MSPMNEPGKLRSPRRIPDARTDPVRRPHGPWPGEERGRSAAAPDLRPWQASDARQRMVDAFQAGQHLVILLSLKAAGTGRTLTRAVHVVHYDRSWNAAVEDRPPTGPTASASSRPSPTA